MATVPNGFCVSAQNEHLHNFMQAFLTVSASVSVNTPLEAQRLLCDCVANSQSL